MGFRKPCAYCRRAIPAHCERRRVLGIIGHDGAFAEYLTLPVVNLHSVHPGIPDNAAVFTEPMAAACEILEQVDVRARGEACVIGDGKLAQLIARVLRSAGLRVVMIGKHESKLALARLAGIATLSLGSQCGWSTHSTWPSKDGFALRSCAGAANHRPARHARAQVHISRRGPGRDLAHRGQGADCHRLALRPVPAALALLRSGRVDPRPLISRVFELKDAAEAVRYAQEPGVMKVLLRVS